MSTSRKKEIIKPNDVLAPTLFVGVGGTGCNIIKRVSGLCLPEEKENVSFLYLDTNVNDLIDCTEGKSHSYSIQTSNTQTVGMYLDYDEDARKNWFPKNAVMYDKTVSEGAGQVRAISRLALNSTIKTGRIKDLYASIDDLFRKNGEKMKQAMRCVIATTASGGTGSGIALTLSMYIRSYIKEKYPNTSLIIRSLVLLPETLDSVITTQTERDSQARNAYATIKEINAFMMKGSGFIDLDEDLKQFKNIHVDVPVAGSDIKKSLSLLPMDFCFLMDGQDAQDSTMISKDQYAEQAAQALYEQNIGPMQKKAFSEEDNIIKEMTKPGNFGRNRFGGLGAGVIRYPYESIVDYVAYDLAIGSIGDGEAASNWTKYDKAYEVYKNEQKKQGIPSTAIQRLGDFYVDRLSSGKDNFSKDLKNAYVDEQFDASIDSYLNEFNSYILEEVRSCAELKEKYDIALGSKDGRNYKSEEGDDFGQDVSNLNSLFEASTRAGKDGRSKVETVASRAVDAMFTGDSKASSNILPSYSLEKFLKTSFGEFFHPCAVRYALYKLQNKLRFQIDKVLTGKVNTIKSGIIDIKDNNSHKFKFKKDEIDGLNALVDEAKAYADLTFFDKLKGYADALDELENLVPSYCGEIIDYISYSSKLYSYQRFLNYIDCFAEEYENFFRTFPDKTKELNRKKSDLVDALAYKKGNSSINVCAEKEILEELSKYSLSKAQKETALLNSDVNADIFDAVKNNAIFNMELRNSGEAFIEEDRRIKIFEDILMGYFKDSVRDKCDDIDKDIIGAIELEQRLSERIAARKKNNDNIQVFEEVSLEDAQNHIKEMVEIGKRIAAPSIQRISNEEPREIELCAYNVSLLDNRKFNIKNIIPKGTPTETVSKYELHFFNALYNLTPDKLKKFAAPSDSETGHRDGGTYHRAYFEYSKHIGPDSTKNAAISTHIDKRWDSIKSMPELDLNYQKKVIERIHKAYIYGLIHGAIYQKPLSQVANGKTVFTYRNSDNRDEELVVPNGTLCDEFYEILDALYVNSKVVEDIGVVKAKKRALSEAKNCDYENTEFFRDMAKFNLLTMIPNVPAEAAATKYDGTQKNLEAIKKEIRENRKNMVLRTDDLNDWEDDGKRYVENTSSLFEIPLFYHCSLPNSERYISEISSMVDAVVAVFLEEYQKWEKEEDVKFVLCNRLTDELTLLKRNYQYYVDGLNADKAEDNVVIDLIQRKVKEVILTAPEPADYEAMLDRLAKEFIDK